MTKSFIQIFSVNSVASFGATFVLGFFCLVFFVFLLVFFFPKHRVGRKSLVGLVTENKQYFFCVFIVRNQAQHLVI